MNILGNVNKTLYLHNISQNTNFVSKIVIDKPERGVYNPTVNL